MRTVDRLIPFWVERKYIWVEMGLLFISFFHLVEIEVQLGNLGHCKSEEQHKRTIQSEKTTDGGAYGAGGKTLAYCFCVRWNQK